MMPGYQYRTPRHPHVRLTITPEQEAAIEADLKHQPRIRISDEMAGLPLKPGRTLKVAASCGTLGGYSAHRRYGETSCDSCKAAAAAYRAANRPSRARKVAA